MTHKSKDEDARVDHPERATAARRGFMLGALAALPTATLLAACGDESADVYAEELPELDAPLAKKAKPHECAIEEEVAAKRLRWRALLDVHVGGESAHDLEAIMETFDAQGEMIFNDQVFRDPDSIAAAHAGFGMAQMAGGIADLQLFEDRIYYTDAEILVRGRVLGQHVGQIGPFPPTDRLVELPYHAFYRFNEQGKLVSERVVMDWSPLAGA